MVQEFTVDYRMNEEFDYLVAFNLAFEGFGSALMLGSALINYTQGIVLGLLLVGVGVLFLFFHLGNRFRCWRVIARLKNSWISRGAFFAGGLMFFGVLSLLADSGALDLAAQAGIIIFALLTILYSGFLLASMTPIPFWNTPLTPVLFLLHSATTGTAILLFMRGYYSVETIGSGVVGLLLLLTGATLLLTIIHVMVMSSSTNAARESVRLLLKDGLKLSFVGGAVVLGLIVPLILFGYLYFYIGQTTQNLLIILAAAVVSRIIGDYTFRSSILHAGVFEMLI